MDQTGRNSGPALHSEMSGDFAHEMLREIHEQPQALGRTLQLYLMGNALRPETIQRLKEWAGRPRGDCRIGIEQARRIGRRDMARRVERPGSGRRVRV